MRIINTDHYTGENLTILRSKIRTWDVLIELLKPEYDKYYPNGVILSIEKSKYKTELDKLIE